MSDAPFTMFVPFGSGYGNPGLTIRAESMDELLAIFKDLNDTGVEETSKLDTLLEDVLTVKAGVLLKFPQEEKKVASAAKVDHPQAQSNPGDAPNCNHGAMKYKSGTSKAGNDYKGWFCPAPHGQTQCTPKFIK
jgi:hypothetical protein